MGTKSLLDPDYYMLVNFLLHNVLIITKCNFVTYCCLIYLLLIDFKFCSLLFSHKFDKRVIILVLLLNQSILTVNSEGHFECIRSLIIEWHSTPWHGLEVLFKGVGTPIWCYKDDFEFFSPGFQLLICLHKFSCEHSTWWTLKKDIIITVCCLIVQNH